MTTTITVKANHGWPVDVLGYKPNGEPVGTYGGRVAPGETRDFYCTSDMDLRVHEVQPEEAGEPFSMGAKPQTTIAFALEQPVALKLSGEPGSIIGHATYARRPPQFFVEYVAGDGRQVTDWFDAEALTAA